MKGISSVGGASKYSCGRVLVFIPDYINRASNLIGSSKGFAGLWFLAEVERLEMCP